MNTILKIKIISRAFRSYRRIGKTLEDFEEDYGCTVIYDEGEFGIKGIEFHNASNKTVFMLKFNK